MQAVTIVGAPAEALNLGTQQGGVAAGVAVDARMIADALGARRKLQRRSALRRGRLSRAHACYDQRLGVPAQRVLHACSKMGFTHVKSVSLSSRPTNLASTQHMVTCS